MRRIPRTVLAVAIALVLLAALAFLFARTQASGHKDDLQALALLRELRDADARWDADALRIANHPGPAAAVADRDPLVSRIFQELEHGPGQAAVGAQVPALRAAMAEKQQAFRRLRDGHARSHAALGAAQDALGALLGRAAALKWREDAAGRHAQLLARIEQVRAGLRVADIEAHADAARALETHLATLPPAATAVDPQLAGAALGAEAAAREYLAARASEAAAWRQFSFLTVGARIELLGRSLARSLDAALDDKDRWRVYLLAYAAALLVGVGYLALRVVHAQAALREANRDLEARVAARTRDLESTLTQLKESEAQLVQTEKMSSLGRLVAGVAHEINTPLSYVKNSVATVRDRMPQLREALAGSERLLEMLHAEAPDAQQLHDSFAELQRLLGQLAHHEVLKDLDVLTRDGLHGIEQIAELVANLRNFSRLDRSRVASFNVNEGVRATLLIAKPALRKIDVEKRLGDIPSITCSPSQVNQVLLNLVTNAAQAIDKPRGRIGVATRREGAGDIAIEVSDNGRGIAPEALARIFDPFFTTKEPGTGTGLGLSIAYKIVAQHGGRIDVRSEPGVGSTFTVTLPVRPPAPLAAHPHATGECIA